MAQRESTRKSRPRLKTNPGDPAMLAGWGVAGNGNRTCVDVKLGENQNGSDWSIQSSCFSTCLRLKRARRSA